MRDALALDLHYRKPLLSLPSFCDGCGAPFTTEHALHCRVEGLVGQHHAVGDLASLAWGQVTREPVVCKSSTSSSGVTLIADLRVYVVLDSLRLMFFFDVHACCWH